MNLMSLDDITTKIRGKLAAAGHIRARVKFDFGDDGIVFVDSTQNPPAVSNEDAESDVTLACSADTFRGFLAGTQDPNIAFMMGKLKVKGSMGLAMKLNGILED
ncbi:MAG: SCP2 sterol-binding domain-containing protein [Alphaproteobacteria bacterium]